MWDAERRTAQKNGSSCCVIEVSEVAEPFKRVNECRVVQNL